MRLGPSKQQRLKNEAEKKRMPKPLPLEQCLAKTRTFPDGRVAAGRTVEEHCLIAAAVAEELLKRNSFLLNFLPENSAAGARLHDVGKVSPVFQHKIYYPIDSENLHPSLTVPGLPANEEEWETHASISYATLEKILDDERLAKVVGSHHGHEIIDRKANYEGYGGVPWEEAREELVGRLMRGGKYPEIGTIDQMRALIGLTVVADWIASGDFFSDPAGDWEADIATAVDQAGFVYPAIIQGLKFQDIFSFAPNDMQSVVENRVTGPGVHILEAPMGMGKTEAALYAAYKMLEQGLANGIYFALPTQLTSNRIYERVNAFLAKILKPGSPGARLLHANAHLQRFLNQQMGKGVAGGDSWFDHGKRGILAPFAVGTIDQALMAVMNVKHAGLRALGLVGKVVILDEVHSYDAYMGVVIDELVKFLQAAGCIVIILSATLTESRRNQFYLGDGPAAGAQGFGGYPLLTSVSKTDGVLGTAIPAPPDVEVVTRLCHDQNDAVVEALKRAEQGQQVLWIENTIRSAQEIYRLCAARSTACGVSCGLVHSHFTQADREKREKEWTEIYGKDSPERNKTGRILVGTQVLEQSLDLDADFLITRLAPTDMILQRMGRLWRHERGNRNPAARRETWILAPAMEKALENPDKSFGSNAKVYNSYVLCRTLEAWKDLATVKIPSQIRQLLEATYQERQSEATKAMEIARGELNAERNRQRNLGLRGLSEFGKIMGDDIPPTRLNELENVKVLLLAGWDADSRICELLDENSVALEHQPDRKKKQEIAAALSGALLSMPAYLAPKFAEGSLDMFKPYIYEAKINKLRLAIIGRGGVATDIAHKVLENVSYSREIGYCKD